MAHSQVIDPFDFDPDIKQICYGLIFAWYSKYVTVNHVCLYVVIWAALRENVSDQSSPFAIYNLQADLNLRCLHIAYTNEPTTWYVVAYTMVVNNYLSIGVI